MTVSLDIAKPDAGSIPLEKTALETYVAPAKPSLIGLSRAQLAEALGVVGVKPAQQKMRAQQLWHWMYVRGVTRCLLYTSPSPRDGLLSRMPSSA